MIQLIMHIVFVKHMHMYYMVFTVNNAVQSFTQYKICSAAAEQNHGL